MWVQSPAHGTSNRTSDRVPILRQSGSKRAVHGARRALHTTQSCYNPATIVADCGFRLDPIAILLQSRSIVARLHHLGPQSCHNRAPIVHQSSVHSAQGAGGRVSGLFVEIPGASNRASILYQSDEMFSRLELDCKQKLITIGK